MATRHLEKFFAPKSVAIISAALVDNLKGSYEGQLYLMHPRHRGIGGMAVHARIEDLDQAPDLAMLATSPETIPEMVSLLGAHDTRAVVIVAVVFD